MDEMHRGLRQLGVGYKLTNGPRIGSRGYCDDTYIVAETAESLQRMNDEVIYPFFHKHGLLINEVKTKVTGINVDGSPYEGQMFWPGSGIPFETVHPAKPVRYLGALITLTLDWTPQINAVQAMVAMTAAHLESGRLTLYQGICITKFVTGPKMEIAMRHADIPRDVLCRWDKWLNQALCRRAGIFDKSIHISGIAAAFQLTPLEDMNDTVKLCYLTELLTRESELLHYYRSVLTAPLRAIQAIVEDSAPEPPQLRSLRANCDTRAWPTLLNTAVIAATRRLWVAPNDKSCQRERRPTASSTGTQEHTFRGACIPIRDTHDLWGTSFDHITALFPLISHQSLNRVPQEVVALAALDCHRTDTTYHCPGCPRADDHKARACTLGEAIVCRLERANCAACSDLWHTIALRASRHVQAYACTDGSTFPNDPDRPSAAAFILLVDGADKKDLWGSRALAGR